ncbi:hypothetical protein DPMN_030632 [Dreissena polymorpha]|uniref:Uncharacterized protein n=1 Tax=Dreissena polymorpha TaxID=45954 RepID=A0A9D4LZD6_DREPO|nr:hypothetical protein DPMN_030632 [Dreissena polymorpha]
MKMWRPYAFVIFHLFLVICRSNFVAAKRNETLLECASDADITFGYISSVSNTSISIAECDKTIKACFLKPSLDNKYHLSYTDHGGILHIKNQDEFLSGTYTCYKTYSPSNFVRMGIIVNSCADLDKATDYTDIIHVVRVTTIERSIVYPLIVVLMLLLCTLLAIEYRKMKNLKDLMEMKNTSDNLLTDRPRKEEDDIHEPGCGYTEVNQCHN